MEATIVAVRKKFEARIDEILEEEKKKAEKIAPKPSLRSPADNPDAEKTNKGRVQSNSKEIEENQNKNTKDEHEDIDEEQKRRLIRQEAQKQAYYVHKQQVKQNQWVIITVTHNDIIEHFETNTVNDYVIEHEELEEMYEEVMVKLQEKLEEFAIQQNKVNIQQEGMSGYTQQDLKLPVLQLPTFSGDYRQWKSFIDLFEQAIHNNEKLGNAQKIHYLKTHVTGGAAKIIQQLKIMDSNYETVKEALMNKFPEILIEFSQFSVGKISNRSQSLLLHGLLIVFKEKIQGEAGKAIQHLGGELTWDKVKAELITYFRPRRSYKQLIDECRNIKVLNLRELFNM